jgi:hypothetical protein
VADGLERGVVDQRVEQAQPADDVIKVEFRQLSVLLKAIVFISIYNN